jgi:tyrosinase
MVARKFTSKPIALPAAVRTAAFKHAELDFFEVDHSGASYQGRVFFNNPSADENTPRELESGYAGAFHIFGHGGCFGEVGHCEVMERRADDTRNRHPLTPTEVSVDVTQTLRHVASRDQLTVTVVPVILSATPKSDTEDCFHFDGMRLLLRNPHGEEVALQVEQAITVEQPLTASRVFRVPVAQLPPAVVEAPLRVAVSSAIIGKGAGVKSASSKGKGAARKSAAKAKSKQAGKRVLR